MQLPVVSLTSTSPPAAGTAADEAEGAKGFDNLLAALLGTATDTALPLAADTLAPATDAIGSGSPTENLTPNAELAVSTLLASLPATRMLMSPAAGSVNASAVDTTGEAGLPTTSAVAASSLPAFGTDLYPAAAATAAAQPAPAGTDTEPASTQRPAHARVMAEPAAPTVTEASTSLVQPAQEEHEFHAAPPTLMAGTEPRPPQGPEALARVPQPQAVLNVAPPLADAGWKPSFAEQVLWVARAELQSASLTLNPPALGPVSIELQLNDAQAIASFGSAVPEVRKAIEDALPALKAIFADAGLQLQQANVGNGEARQQQAQAPRQPAAHSAGKAADSTDEAADPAKRPAVLRASRLLDTFA